MANASSSDVIDGRAFDRRGFMGAGVALGAGALGVAGLSPGVRAETGSTGAFSRNRSARVGTILPWEELAPGVHAMVNLDTGGNVCAIVSDGAAAVVDSKYPAYGAALRADALTLAGLGGDGAVDLINTHHHGDHTAGNYAFVRETGTSVAHVNALPRIRAQVERFRQGAAGAAPQVEGAFPDNERLSELASKASEDAGSAGERDWTPRVGVGDASNLRVGGATLALRHFGPGHTDNDLVIHHESANVVHVGDLVFNGLHPFFDPTAGVTAKGWVESLDSILELCDADTIVIPGHGPVGKRSIVRTQRRYVEKLIHAVRREMRAGKAKDEIAGMTFDFMEGLRFEQFRGRAINAVYDELAAE